jgi:hypothetical protein
MDSNLSVKTEVGYRIVALVYNIASHSKQDLFSHVVIIVIANSKTANEVKKERKGR